jgi:tetratricopeptide (TPR) repeat protein
MTSRRSSGSTTRPWRPTLAALLSCLLALVVCSSAASGKKDDEKKRKQYTVGESMHDKLTEAQEAFATDDMVAARAALESLAKKQRRMNPYEKALVYLYLAHVAANEEKYDEALGYFEISLAEDALPPSQQLNTRFNVAHLYLAAERFQDAIRSLELWFEDAENPNSVAFYLLAVAHYQVGDVEGAIEPAREAVLRAEKPEQNWLQLLVGTLFETKRYEEALDPLEQLVTLYPKKAYWTQLSALYHHLEREPRSLAAMQIAFQEGFFDKDREYRQLALLLLSGNLPYRAALVLEKGLEEEILAGDAANWELLANSWLLARENERSLEPLQRAATLSGTGELYVRLGQVYLERERWKDASEALEQALAKGDLKDRGHANLLMGISLYHQEQPDRARSHFDAALTSDTTRDSATIWIHMLDRDTDSG